MLSPFRLLVGLLTLMPGTSMAQAGISGPSDGKEEFLAIVQSGPATPTLLRDSLALPDTAVARYSEAYTRHMARTKPQRDQAVAALKKKEGPQAATGRRSPASRLVRAILRQDSEFEDIHLMPLLNPEQRRAFRIPRMKSLYAAARQRSPATSQ